MLKEIYEQPEVLARIIGDHMDAAGRIHFPGLAFPEEEIRAFSKIMVAASGSSRHAGMVGEFMIERMTGLPVEVDFASQYCYRDPVVVPHELTIFLSQSGTTIDTLTALQVARRKGTKSLAIVNVPDTPLTQNADSTVLTHADLYGVSCTGRYTCTAVGQYTDNSGNTVTLAEDPFNDGSIQPTPNPAGSTGSSLTGVSCMGAHTCTAVGSYDTSPGATLPLAEAE